jgi:hypothetical protein
MDLFNRVFSGSRKARKNRPIQYRRPLRRPSLESLEERVVPSQYTPGNLIVLQAGNGSTFTNQGPLFLNEYPPTVGGARVQQAAIPSDQAAGGTGNQPITIDLTAAAGNGQLTRTFTGDGLVFGGVDSTVNNGGYTSPQSPTGNANRIEAVVGNDLANISAATWSSGTVTITANNDYTAGESITISGILVGGSSNNGYNGTFTISSPTSTSFQYSVSSNPGTAQGSGTIGLAGNTLNTTNYGPYYIGDDNRGGVATTVNGPVYTFGHPNQAGGAVSQGVLYFAGPNGDGSLGNPGNPGNGAQSGVQVSSETNIRGGYFGIDTSGQQRLYWTTAGSNTLGTAGIYTSSVTALPTNNSPGLDQPVVLNPVTNSKVGGMFIADVNGDGVIDNGDRIYLLDDGTVAGAGSGGVFMAVFNSAIWGVGGSIGPVSVGSFTQSPGWSPMVRIAEGVIDAQPTPQTTAQLRGVTGTVLAGGNVQLYASEFDNVAGNNSYILSFLDNSPGVTPIASATEVGTTVTLTLPVGINLPASYTTNAWVSVNKVGTSTGAGADVGGYNGVWQITATGGSAGTGFTFSYTDTTSGLTNASGGVTDNWLNSGSVGGSSDPYPVPASSQIFQTMADGTDGATASAAQALRGVSFAPVAATTLTNFQVNGGSSATVSPGTNVNFTVHVSNPQSGVTLTGLPVTFIDQTTNSIIGQGTINSSGDVTFTTTTPLVGNHTVGAFFGGGGPQALATAKASTTVQVNEAGSTASRTTLVLSIGGSSTSQAAVGRSVTLTATVADNSGGSGTPTNNVSFYNGSVSPANFLGTGTVTTVSGSQQASITTSFSTPGSLTIIAVYNGDNNFASSQDSKSLTVAANATAVITTSANNVAVGATPTYTATLTGTLGTVTGTVQFFLDGTALGSAQTLSGGAASVTSTALTAGSHLITISYTPDTTSPYNAVVVNTYSSASNGTANVALIETAKQALKPGNLIAIQRGDGSINLGSSGYLVFLVEYTTAGKVVQRIALPNADSGVTHALLLSGQNGAEGLSQKSANGQYITIVGYDTPVGQSFVTSTQPYQFARTIARIDGSGNVDTSTDIKSFQSMITAATWNSGIVTITAPNNAVPGNPVTISGMTPAGYNGTYTVLSATAASLTYVLTTNPGSETVLGTATGPSVPFNPEDVVSSDGTQFWLASSLGTGDTTDTGLLYATLGGTTATQIGPVNHGVASVTITGTGPSQQLALVLRGAGELGAPQGLDFTTTALPSVPTALSALPNLETEYEAVFPTGRAPEGVALLNTADGTANNPNLAYIADQAYGLLKFWKASNGNWHLGQLTTNAFGEKLVFSGGATSVVANIVSPGTASASVSIYVTGSNVQQANPNQIAFFSDANGAPAGTAGTGVDQGFSSGSFSTIAFTGGAQGANPPTSFNGNENFGGLTYAPGNATTSTVTGISPNVPTAVYGTSFTLTATVTSAGGDTPAGTVTFMDGTQVLGTSAYSSSGTFTLTTTAMKVGPASITAVYNPGGVSLPIDDSSTSPAFAGPDITYNPGDVVVDTVQTGAVVGGTISAISENGSNLVTVTTTSPTFLQNNQRVVLAGVGVAGYNNNYDNTYQVTVTGANTFTFTLPRAFTGLASSSGGTVTLVYSGTAGSATVADYSPSGTHNSSNDVALSTAANTATITNITVASGTATVTANNGFAAGQSVVISGVIASVTPSPFNGTFTILSANSTSFTFASSTTATYTSGGAAAVATTAFTENGSIGTNPGHSEGAITTSVDGHTASIAGYNQAVGGSTGSIENRLVGVLADDATVNALTSLPSVVGSVRATVAADGLGLYVATNNGLSYIPFDSTADVSAITAATWASGVVTITANNNFAAGEIISVVGISPGGYNGSFTILSATATQFTYALATNPGSTTNVLGALAQLVPTIVSNEANNPGNGGQTPNAVYIGAFSPDSNAGITPSLYGTDGNQFQPNGIASIDGPVAIGPGSYNSVAGGTLPQAAGQAIRVLGSGTATNWPNSRDVYNNFPSSQQVVVSPDGNTIMVADDRGDGLGGILVYQQFTANNWHRVATLPIDAFTITGASESGTVATVTTSTAVDFTVGQVVSVQGLNVGAYNTNSAIVLSVAGDGKSFTYDPGFSNLPTSPVGPFGAIASSLDGGFNTLTGTIDNDGNGTLYATTSDTSGNRLYKIAASGTFGTTQTLTPTLLATAAANTAFRGVALAPVAAGTTASSVSISGGANNGYAQGTTITATVNAGATGWVSFRSGSASGPEVGAAPIIGNTATWNTASDLAPGSYTLFAVYTGDSTFATNSSSALASFTVSKSSTTTSVTLTPQNAGTGQTVTITAQVVVPAGTAPTGTMVITDGNGHTFTVPVIQTIANPGSGPVIQFLGTATTSYSSLGSFTVNATYSGDANFTGSSGSATESVVNSTVTTVTSSAANPTASPSTNVTFTAAVTSPSSSTTATGSVQFYDNTEALGAPVNLNGSGVATLTVPTSLFQEVSLLSETETGTTATITVNANNPFTSGQMVTIAAVAEGSNGQVNGNYSGGYNGTFAVTPVSGHPNQYTFTAPPGLPSGNTGGYVVAINTLSPGLHSVTAIYTPTGTTFAGSVGIHQQAVQAAPFTATDTFDERLGDGLTPLNTRFPSNLLGSVGASNFVDEINSSQSLVQSLALPVADSQIFTATAASESGSTVTLTLNSPTDYAIGDLVTVSGVSVAGYNGTFQITAVSNPSGGPYTIQYTDSTTGLGAGTGGTAQGVVHGVVGHGQQSTTGQLSLSANGGFLFLTGYDQDPNMALPGYGSLPSVSNAAVPRSIARIAADGSIATEAFTAGASGVSTSGNFNAVFSPDGNQFYIAGAGGKIYYFSSLTQSATLQGGTAGANVIATASATVTGLEGFNGQLYFIGGGNTSGTNLVIGTVGTGYPTGTATLTQLPGIPTNSTTLPTTVYFPVDVFFTHLNGAGTAPDTLYISDDGLNFGQGAITKWSLVSGNWTQNTGSIQYSQATQQLGFYWLAGRTSSGNVTLFSTYGNGGNADFGPGIMYQMTDTSGYNHSITLSGTGVTTVVVEGSAPVGGPFAGNKTVRGVANAPQATPTATTLVANGISAATAGGSIEQGFTPSFTVNVGVIGGGPTATGTVQLEDAANGNALVGPATTLVNGTATIPVLATGTLGAGTHQLIAVYSPSSSEFATSTSSQVGQKIDATFKVQTHGVGSNLNFNQTSTGFQATFNAFVNTAPLNIYGPGGTSIGIGDAVNISTATEAGSTVTITTSAAHGYFTGEKVVITGVNVAGYNGVFTVLTVPDSTHFTYTAADTGLGAGSGGQTGAAISGSVVWDKVNTEFTYVTTGTWSSGVPVAGQLAAGTYLVYLDGGHSYALADTSNDPLAGDGTNAGTGFMQTFTVAASSGTLISAPYFARGIHQAVNLPGNSSNGIPISIMVPSSGTAVTAATFDITYDPTLLNVSAAAVTAAGFTGGTATVDQVHGVIHVNLGTGGTIAANNTPVNVVTITAAVQDTAPQKDKEVFHFVNVTLNGAAGITGTTESDTTVTVTTSAANTFSVGDQVTISGVSVAGYNGTFTVASVIDSTHFTYTDVAGLTAGTGGSANNFRDGAAVHAVAFNADVDANGTYNGTDSNGVSQYAVHVTNGKITTGFAAYKLLDPFIIADTNSDGVVNGTDSNNTSQAAVGKFGAIPALPVADISTATESGTLVTITTVQTNGFTDLELVTISNVAIGGSTNNAYNGTFTIHVTSGTTFTYTTTSGLGNGSGGQARAASSAGGPDPVLYISNVAGVAGSTVTVAVNLAITETTGTVAISSTTESGHTVTVTTASAHGFTQGQQVDISAVVANTGLNNTVDNGYNGLFTVASVIDSTHFTYVAAVSGLANGTGGNAGIPGSLVYASDDMGIYFDPSLFSVSNARVGAVNGPSVAITSATEASGGTTVTIVTAAANGFSSGQTVAINGVSVGGYNGLFTVTVVNSTTFTYTAGSSGLPNGSGGSAALNYLSPTNVGTSSNIDNTAGTIRIDQFFSGSTNPTLPTGSIGAILLLDFTVLSSAPISTSSLNLGQNVSSSFTVVNGGAAPLNPAPTNGGTDPVDGVFNIVPQSAEISIGAPTGNSSLGSAGGGNIGDTVSVPVYLTIGTGGFTYASDDMGIRFDPAELQLLQVNGSTTYPGIGNNLGTSSNIDNTAGTVRIDQFFSGTTNPFLSQGTSAPILTLVFQIPTGAAIENTVIDLAKNVSSSFTIVNGGDIPLIPAPSTFTGAFNSPSDDTDPTDGIFAVNIRANQFPTESVPSSNPPVLFNSAAVAGLQTATPNTEVFNGNIIVGDPNTNAGVTDSTVLTVTGTPTGTSTGSVGFLTVPAGFPSDVTVTNNGTAQVTVAGPAVDITTALKGLVYTPGAGFFGTTVLDVKTTNNNPTAFPTSLTVDRSTIITVVGLFESEIFLSSTSNLNTPSANQYLEIFSSAPSYTIPSNVYLVGIQGNNSTVTDIFGNSTTNAPGDVTDVFNLGGFVTGTNGYLALLEKGQNYPAADVNSAGTVVTNSGTQSGFGNGGGSSVFGSRSGVHVGQDQSGGGGRLGTNPDLPGDAATFAGELSWDMPMASSSYLLIQAPSAPVVQTTTTAATNIDAGILAGGAATGKTGGAYATWNVLDGIGILAAPLNPTGGGTYTQNGPDFTYSPMTFQSSSNSGSVLTGSNVLSVPFTANWVGRISLDTGSTSADWLASVPGGSPFTFALGAGNQTSNTTYSGQPLNNIGGPNFWADQMKVVVNDGTNAQHSQVSELTLTFASPVRLAGTADRFQITSAVDNGSAAVITTSAAHDFMVGQTINIIGVTGTGWNGNHVVTAITSTTVTFALGTITANGTTSASSFAQATGSLSTSFRNIFQVLDANNNPINLVFTIPTGGGTYNSTTGVATNVTVLVIRFLSSGSDTFTFGHVDPFGNTVGLNDGNYFLNTNASLVTDGQGQQLDGDRNGTFGGNGHDEFWRLFGDSLGRRQVDNTDVFNFNKQFGVSNPDTNVLAWFFDFNMDNVINNTDLTAILANRGKHLNA